MEVMVSWRYDAKYKEVRINIDNNDKNTGLKKKEPKDKDNDYSKRSSHQK
jgi:hypothetical protein